MKPEEKARQDIDNQLKKADWIIQDRLNFNLGAGPQALLSGNFPQKSAPSIMHCSPAEKIQTPAPEGFLHLNIMIMYDSFSAFDNSEGLITWLDGWQPDDFAPKKIEFDDPRKHFQIGLEE